MSFRAVDRAFDQPISSSSDKFVLVVLASYTGDAGIAYPSTATIAAKTSLNWKTVTAALDRLEKAKIIVDTGKRVGRTKQIKVYKLTWADESLPKSEASQNFQKGSQIYLENHQEPSVPLSPDGEHVNRMLAFAKSRPYSEKHVVAFCKSISLPDSDAEYFWNHWSGNGYKNNGKAMVDWQATIRAWKAAGHCPSQKHNARAFNATKPMTTYDIKARIEVIDEELGKTEYDKDKPAVAAKRKELWAKKKALKAKLLE